ncbi:hypothetical protein BDN72DRAFT_772601, partial [Pluteus cervinus]
MDKFKSDKRRNIYHPFRNRDDWQVAVFLLRSDMSMARIDEFLKLSLIQQLELSFTSAKDLRDKAESLPAVAPWKCRTIKTDPNYPAKKKLELYYRNPVEVIQNLLQNPLITDHIHYTPFRAFTCAQRVMRLYSE